jgi:hypothetical protein
LFHRSSRQIESPADAGSTSLAIRDPCSRNILHAAAARIEDYEFVLGHAPTLSACREVGKFSMDLVFRHGPRTQRVVEIAAGSTSLNVIHKDARTAHRGRSNLLLLGVVGTDGRNEAPPQFQIVGQDRRFRRCAGDTNVHVSYRIAYARRRRHGVRCRRICARERFRTRSVNVKHPHLFQRKNRLDGFKLIPGLGSAADDGHSL